MGTISHITFNNDYSCQINITKTVYKNIKRINLNKSSIIYKERDSGNKLTSYTINGYPEILHINNDGYELQQDHYVDYWIEICAFAAFKTICDAGVQINFFYDIGIREKRNADGTPRIIHTLNTSHCKRILKIYDVNGKNIILKP